MLEHDWNTGFFVEDARPGKFRVRPAAWANADAARQMWVKRFGDRWLWKVESPRGEPAITGWAASEADARHAAEEVERA